jgi:diguanylate cyclase (GGDEF)-like protein
MSFHRTQSLNQWVAMLDALYGGSQNYAKTPYEIHAHLTEVTGVFAKNLFKRRDFQKAEAFLPKIFSWSVALFRKMHSGSHDLEDIILRKFPSCCSYCLQRPCVCWNGEKPSIDEQLLRNIYYQNASSVRRTVNDFQLMFRGIYGPSWLRDADSSKPSDELLRGLFIRLAEEVAEVGEAIRFHHLYPENFDNELSDVLAWWFALVSNMPNASKGTGTLLAEDCLWHAYPGQCPDCQLIPCLCRPGPVRQLMSRPIPGFDHRFDALTSALNQAAYKEDQKQIMAGEIALTFPSSCVRLDVDKFKSVNDTYGHSAGDEALRHIAAIIRRTVRERDRVYRISGDEYGVLCADFTEEEAAGAMRRVCTALSSSPVRWVSQKGEVSEFTVSVSAGVSEFSAIDEVAAAFEYADQAARKSYPCEHPCRFSRHHWRKNSGRNATQR